MRPTSQQRGRANRSLPATTRPSSKPRRENQRSFLPASGLCPSACDFSTLPSRKLRGWRNCFPSPTPSSVRTVANLPATRSGPGRPFRPHPAALYRSLLLTSRQALANLPASALLGNRPRSLSAGDCSFCSLRSERMLPSGQALIGTAGFCVPSQETSGRCRPSGPPFSWPPAPPTTCCPPALPPPSRPASLPPEENHPLAAQRSAAQPRRQPGSRGHCCPPAP